MTIEKKYKCNVCNEYMDSLTGVGIRFGIDGIEKDKPMITETHLCYKCINSIKKFTNKGEK